MRYHSFRSPTAFSAPHKPQVQCIRCGTVQDTMPTPAELAADPCPTHGQWSPPDLWFGDSSGDLARARSGLEFIARRETDTVMKIQQALNIKNKDMGTILKDIDWLFFVTRLPTAARLSPIVGGRCTKPPISPTHFSPLSSYSSP